MVVDETLLGYTSEFYDVFLSEPISLIAAHHATVATTTFLLHALLLDVALHHQGLFLSRMLTKQASG